MKMVKMLGMEYATEKSKSKSKFAIYKCPICDEEFRANVYNVNKGTSTKCKKCANRKHGDFKTRLYSIWRNMLSRARSDKEYYTHVDVCKEWEDWLVFKEWAKDNQYSELSSIDRIDNSKGYHPNNCRFATNSEQCANRGLHKSNTTGYRGVIKSGKKFGAQIKYEGKHVWLGTFDTKEEGAKAFDDYVLANGLPHQLNFKRKKQ
jgi:hypothetical protein